MCKRRSYKNGEVVWALMMATTFDLMYNVNQLFPNKVNISFVVSLSALVLCNVCSFDFHLTHSNWIILFKAKCD